MYIVQCTVITVAAKQGIFVYMCVCLCVANLTLIPILKLKDDYYKSR